MFYREFLLNNMGTMLSPFFMGLLAIIIAWSLIWKGIALWKSGRNNQLAWFIVLLVVNTVGVLEIIYLLFFQKKAREAGARTAGKKR